MKENIQINQNSVTLIYRNVTMSYGIISTPKGTNGSVFGIISTPLEQHIVSRIDFYPYVPTSAPNTELPCKMIDINPTADFVISTVGP